jgi:hypothetical protein
MSEFDLGNAPASRAGDGAPAVANFALRKPPTLIKEKIAAPLSGTADREIWRGGCVSS